MKNKTAIFSIISGIILIISLYYSVRRQAELSEYIKSKKILVTQNISTDTLTKVKVRVLFVQNREQSFDFRYKGRGFVNFQNKFYFNKIGINLDLKYEKVIIDQELAYFNDNIVPAFTFVVSSRKYYKEGYITILIKKPDQDLVLLDKDGEIKEDIKDSSGLLGVGIDKVLIMNEDQFGKSTLLHEMFHAVGLYHVDDEFNIMYPYDTKRQVYLSESQIHKFKTNLNKI